MILYFKILMLRPLLLKSSQAAWISASNGTYLVECEWRTTEILEFMGLLKWSSTNTMPKNQGMGSMVPSHWRGIIPVGETLNSTGLQKRYYRNRRSCKITNQRGIINIECYSTTFVCSPQYRGTFRDIRFRRFRPTKSLYVVEVEWWCSISIYMARSLMGRYWWCNCILINVRRNAITWMRSFKPITGILVMRTFLSTKK